MRQLFYTPEGMQLKTDAPEPQIVRPDEVKIKVHYCGICGSDLHIDRKELDYLTFVGGNYFPMGHEASGVITELGPEADTKDLQVGDHVVYYFNEHCGKCHYCRNGQEHLCLNMRINQSAMSDYIVVGEQAVFKLDDDIPMQKAIFHEPISVCLHGIDMAGIKPGNTVLISGGGAIGLIILQLAKKSGATSLTLSEPIAWKREVAKELGAMYTIDPVNQDITEEMEKITGGLGFDVVIEASGSTNAVQGCYESTGRGGLLEFFAALYDFSYDFPLNLQHAFWNEIRLVGGVYQSPYEWPRTMRLFKEMNWEPFRIDESIFEIEDFKAAFEAQKSGKTIKSILKFV